MKIKIGVIGLNFGRWMIEEIQMPPASDFFEITAVCDLDAEKAEKFGRQLNVASYTDLDKFLAEGDMEAAALFSGPVGRAGLIQKIIRAGKDVMTTKPFESDSAAAKEALDEAKRLGRVVHLNSPSPVMTEDMRIIKGWREKHGLGQPIACRSDLWANYREKPSGEWPDDPNQCPVAPIYRLGIYAINDLLQIIGEPESVTVMQSRVFTERPTSDNAQLGIMFKNGAIGNIFASFCVCDGNYYKSSLMLNFENGTISRNGGALKKDKGKLELSAHDGKIEEVAHFTEQSGVYLWESFYKSIKGERPAYDIDPDTVVWGMKVVEAMRKAQFTGETTRV